MAVVRVRVLHNLFTGGSRVGNRARRRRRDRGVTMMHQRNGDVAGVVRAGTLEIRPAEHLAIASGRTLTLSLRELELLTALAERAGRIVPRAELYELVWGAPLRAEDRSVDVYVHKLRSKLAATVPGWRFIHTHFGFGYRFAAERAPGATPTHLEDGH